MLSGLPIWFGASSAGDIFSTLGIDWKLLLLQAGGFLLLVWALGKWIFPIFFRIIDSREEAINAGNKAATEAAAHAKKAEADIKKMLESARGDAAAIIATAKEEAVAMTAEAEQKSKAHAERIVAAAQEDIKKEVAAAKKELHNETIDLVAMATEKVVGTAVAGSVQKKTISSALEESRRS